MEEKTLVDKSFCLFSCKKITPKHPPKTLTTTTAQNPNLNPPSPSEPSIVRETNATRNPNLTSFLDLGLAEWAAQICKELGMKKPTPVQCRCIPRILAGHNVLGVAQTGSGKTVAFALPILHRLTVDPYEVFTLVVTPTRELAYQLAKQFRALGSCLNLRCAVVVGGMDIINQTQTLMGRPHVVITTPGRIKVLIKQSLDIAAFLVLDEADRVLDVGFEEELRVVFQCLPKNRQTLLFSATMTSDLQTLLELPAHKAYIYEAYGGFKTVESLKEQCCHHISLMLEELELDAAALHSLKPQFLRLAALSRFKSEQIPLLVATDVASRGLDIPTVDLVINYDIPRCPKDYVHRVGRTARAGRRGLAVSIVTPEDRLLLHEIEAIVGKKMDELECKENEVLEDITKVFKARRVANMKMLDDGFEERAKVRQEQKLKKMSAKLCMILDLLGSSGSATGIDVARHRLAACRTMVLKYSLGDRCRLFVADGTLFSLLPIRVFSGEYPLDEMVNLYKEWTSRRPWKDKKKAAKARVTVASQLASSTQDPELIYYGKNSGVVGLTRSEIYQTFCGNDVLRCGYDKVLVDAECTHDGSIKHIQKFEYWGWKTLQRRVLNVERTDNLTVLQLQLLTNGFRLLKIGGSLVYSTCSLTVAQNEDVVEQFLLQNASAELLEIDAAKNWPCRSGRIPKTLRFDPMTSRTSGLFVAKFTKLAI
ncbi:hypothetical protein RHGRI_029827 [Rhododendron griersonianum]|uniref:DEA(D/H)-box RNA helicase family protein n=1 Tax=Rhododendron griersonianum TaxID=479676 RepID=A0AAV6INY8_9ERIC|nr:hypothetical protein RHGRI_029827 [Rhododendron griersonianum]KAG5529259.1 hypothetical protein RHGRI_029827 [Rhododendron griersonianum]